MRSNKLWYHITITSLVFVIYVILRGKVLGRTPLLESFFIGYGISSVVFDLLNIIDK